MKAAFDDDQAFPSSQAENGRLVRPSNSGAQKDHSLDEKTGRIQYQHRSAGGN
jgi:hypothetical protein